ncbi:response regulator [Desertifilum sp. FACHB-1129]|uniref:Two-component system response regulator n=1 Tax=Desertifilum tharense IPPAS B-1220 TaxID=1781255 RepID=A0A1E5QIX7_9CYAN|nr:MULTISPECIES: response regulator [Desertifilum]MDA0210204.1 response regulator [Cyanobacteria bacterium FC1]MBD2313647.1 response regulator [Desertifilum sp. FACHB-1129]MBD2320608.1 response regulator [Desertifilum sp. FACHB-866]MBD2330736.1 response regulator [Desertifilum sp. FACHB-868]OEJ74527.1 two-component system response regulator [Desertifilum tharense IPPAS B-1220]
MENVIPELDSISRKLMSMDRPKKPKMLVVDDEPDNLDLLYRTFRRDFQVLRAESGVRALEVLASEGEVAVIISDQRMPEMKGTEFLSRTVPQFPNTMRIILTGFTDVEDLVEAINSGQVYKYITKPWDPNELKAVVQRAAETYELLKQRTEELHRAQAQTALLYTIVQVSRESSGTEEILTPLAEAFGKNFDADGCILQLVQGTSLLATQGTYSKTQGVENWLAKDPLAAEAIASSSMQVSVNVAADSALAEVEHYAATGTQAHLIIPITHDDRVLAVLSLQWKQPCRLREDELTSIHLSAQLVALALICTHNVQAVG